MASVVKEFKMCLLATKADPGESRHAAKADGTAQEKTFGYRSLDRYMDAKSFIKEIASELRLAGVITSKTLTALPADRVTEAINQKVRSGEWSVSHAKTTVAALIKAEYGSEKALGQRIHLIDRDKLDLGTRSLENRINIRPFTASETRAIVAWARENAPTEARMGIEVAAGAGLRVSEILNLRVRDIDFGSGRIYVTEGKGGLPREVAMVDAKLLESLKEHCSGKSPDDRVVTCSERTIQRWVAIAKEAVGATSGNGVHGLRGGWVCTCMQELMRQGVPFEKAVEKVSQELGHSRLEVLKHYWH